MPPSPWLSARMTNTQYLIATTRIGVQTISDSTPSTASVESVPPAVSSTVCMV